MLIKRYASILQDNIVHCLSKTMTEILYIKVYPYPQ